MSLDLYGQEIEQRFYQSSWHEINFTDLGVPLSTEKPASSTFYSAFYQQFFLRYEKFSDLSVIWCRNKSETAGNLSCIIPQHAEVLSYGCGIGFMEKELSQQRPDIQLSAFDFSEIANSWLKVEAPSIRLVTNLENTDFFDVIYLCQVLYSMDYKSCVNLLRQIGRLLNPGGIIILINTSASPAENSKLPLRDNDNVQKITNMIKTLVRPPYALLNHLLSKRKLQFWGWRRNNARYLKICSDAGFKIENVYSSTDQSFIILNF